MNIVFIILLVFNYLLGWATQVALYSPEEALERDTTWVVLTVFWFCTGFLGLVLTIMGAMIYASFKGK